MSQGGGWDYDPARDVGLRPFERWRSLAREAGLVEAAVHLGWTAACAGYLKVGHRFRVEGREHLPATPPYVVVANHSSHLDALALSVALRRGHAGCAFPIAAGDTFFETRAAAAFAATFLNALPMWRRSCGAHAMGALRTRLAEGRSIYLLFPEGTRTRTGEMAKFRSGIGMLVAGTSVPVVPAWIDGAFAAMPVGARWPRPRRVGVEFGAAVRFENVANERAGWVRVAAEVEAAVRGLAARHFQLNE
jgi:1-acyl-sn-glycerol-3-phosphate acyltransferase